MKKLKSNFTYLSRKLRDLKIGIRTIRKAKITYIFLQKIIIFEGKNRG